jgi:hypothetical protein
VRFETPGVDPVRHEPLHHAFGTPLREVQVVRVVPDIVRVALDSEGVNFRTRAQRVDDGLQDAIRPWENSVTVGGEEHLL